MFLADAFVVVLANSIVLVVVVVDVAAVVFANFVLAQLNHVNV